jgi:hypothetical protein
MSMQASDSGQASPDELERELRQLLYRFDCPDAHTLGEYQLDVLDLHERTRVAAHAAECDECRAELQTLRAFLAAPVTLPETVAGRARRIVARLFGPTSPELAFGGLRGVADWTTRVYEAGDVTLTLGPGQTSGTLIGLVVAGGLAPESLDGCAVTLVPREGSALRASLDDLGNFELAGIQPGLYALEVGLPNGLVVVEELQVD